ncbi:MAG: exosome complex exonuclease Rrp41 [Candidatus Heimdallarchaeota archaeon]|nr:exosome complex exonuclease Rrp41 [Candidatus Heimdallarchaeota archaeon]
MSNNEDELATITKDGIRHDGRKKDELREISFKVGVLDRADGSALINWGRNKILAAVYGPRELHPKHMAMPDRALIRCEYRMATFSVPDRKSPAPKRREREISKILSEALEPAIFDYLYPRAVIDVFVEVLQADGGTRCASITAASLALADAGIPMRDLVVGCAAGHIEGEVVLDLDDVEDKYGGGDLPMAILASTGDIVLLQSDGTFTTEQYKEAVKLNIEACKKIYKMQRDALTKKYAQIREDVGDDEEEEESSDAEAAEKSKDEKQEKEAPTSDEKKKEEDKEKKEKKSDDSSSKKKEKKN